MVNLTEKIQQLEEQKQAIYAKRVEIDNQILPLKTYLGEAKSRSAFGEYDNPKRFRSAKASLSTLGRECQNSQAELSKINFEMKKLNTEHAKNEDAIREKYLISNERRMISFEAFFIESAKKYLSGNEFEIISKMATNMMAIRNK